MKALQSVLSPKKVISADVGQISREKPEIYCKRRDGVRRRSSVMKCACHNGKSG